MATSYLTTQMVQAWVNTGKVTWATTVDAEFANQIASQVLAKAARAFDTSTWYDESTTPSLILSIIAMIYVGRKFQETYGDDSLNSDYGTALVTDANNMLENLISGDLILTNADGDLITTVTDSVGSVSFEPTESDPLFSIGMTF